MLLNDLLELGLYPSLFTQIISRYFIQNAVPFNGDYFDSIGINRVFAALP